MTPSAPLPYCPDLLTYTRRPTREVWIGNVAMGAAHPIRVQSMITADTRDTPACVAEILGLAEVGCEIVRVTAQTKTYAANLKHIAREVRAAGCHVPLVADIHFKPDAALEAAKWVEKVRINPGNYADKKKFAIREYSDAQYDEELERIREEFTPLVLLCKDLGRAMRIGTNHGSLSDRVMNRYGDTPLGMVESALEFARIARDHDYHALVFSMKASNPKVMIEAYRLLVARLQAAGPDWNYPIHLGVTEAGDGEDGRIKSAIGIGSLLADGIGDTIRVSLTEDSIHEIPVAQALVELHDSRQAQRGAESGWGVSPQAVQGACGWGVSPQAVQGACGWGVSPQAVFGASRPEELAAIAHTIRPDWNLLERKDSTYLPHWRIPGATYAVTFRLDDAVPAPALADYHQRKNHLLERLREAAEHSGSRSTLETLIGIRAEIALLYEQTLDPVLHQAHGACHLKHPELAELVRQALLHFDGTRYTLFAWSVMSNHLHAVVQPAAGQDLEKIVQSWKSFTAKKANEMLGLRGTFWQPEYYDHLIRDGEDFKNQIRYVLENPLRGKASARWTGSKFGGAWAEICGARRPTDGLGRDAPATSPPPATSFTPSYNPFSYERRSSSPLTLMGHALGGENPVRVVTTQDRWNALAHKLSAMGDFKPEIILEKSGVVAIDPRDQAAVVAVNARPEPCLVTVADDTPMAVIPAFRLLAAQVAARHPILLKDTLNSGGGFQPHLQRGCGFQPQALTPLQHDSHQPFIDPTQAIEKDRATFLPHWTQQGGIYAVTFRLADSLPAEVLDRYREERARLEDNLNQAARASQPDPDELSRLRQTLSGLYDTSIGTALDAGAGACHLRKPEVAAMVAEALRHFDGQRYRLLAWCIMPNHVHLVIQPFDGHPLEKILHSIKSFSANAANELLERSGPFWLKESYDHLIRDGEDYRNQIRYLLQNPDKARLVDWRWRGSVYGDSWEEAKRGGGFQPPINQELRQEAATTASLLTAAQNLGTLLCDGIGDAVLVRGETAPGASLRLAYNILQAAGTRIFKTDYVACPSCGRTLFNLQHTTQKIRAATGHLKGVRIAVMGCIVNGPGEMADADFGYVGGAPGKINLYVGKTPVQFNLPEAEAVTRLTDLIRDHGKWVEPPTGKL